MEKLLWRDLYRKVSDHFWIQRDLQQLRTEAGQTGGRRETQAAGQPAPILTQEEQIGIESSGHGVVGTARRRNESSAI